MVENSESQRESRLSEGTLAWAFDRPEPLTSDVGQAISDLRRKIRDHQFEFEDHEILCKILNLVTESGDWGVPLEKLKVFYSDSGSADDLVNKLVHRLNELGVQGSPRIEFLILDDRHQASEMGKVVFPRNLDLEPTVLKLPWQNI